MATPYSNPNLYFQMKPVDPTNWDLAFKALQYKQGQYDTNKLKVDSLVQQYLSTDIVKAETKQRFVDNIRNLINEVNASGQTDFSDSNITNRIMSHIGQALDKPTLNAIALSKQMRQQEDFLKELATKKPDLYNNVNHEDMYRKKGPDGRSFNDWLNDGDATSTFNGQLRYTPYVDLDKKTNDLVMGLMKMNKDTEFEVPHPTNPMLKVKKKISGLTQAELRGIAENMFNTEDLQQAGINARAQYGWYETPESIQALKDNAGQFYSSMTKKYDEQLSSAQVLLSQAVEGSEEYNNLVGRIESYKGLRDQNSKVRE